MAQATFLVCGPTDRGTYSVLSNGSPVFCEMQAVEVVRFLRAATARHQVAVVYASADGTPLERAPPALTFAG